MKTTERRGIKCPESNDFYNIDDFNHNFAVQDTACDKLASAVWSGNTLIAKSEVPVLKLFDGLRIYIKMPAASPAAPLLNLDGLGAIPILRHDSTPPAASLMNADTWYKFMYDGSCFRVSEHSAPLTSPCFKGTPTTAAGTDYGVKKLRNILFGTSAPTASTQWSNGDIFIVYEQQ